MNCTQNEKISQVTEETLVIGKRKIQRVYSSFL